MLSRTAGLPITALALGVLSFTGCSSATPAAPAPATVAATSTSTSAPAEPAASASAAATSTGSTKPACDWLTQDQVAAALGNVTTFERGAFREASDHTTCAFQGADKSYLNAIVYNFPTLEAAKKPTDLGFEDAACTPVTGLGDEAAYCTFSLGTQKVKLLDVRLGMKRHQLARGTYDKDDALNVKDTLAALFQQTKFG